jgi:WD40 repeat protein
VYDWRKNTEAVAVAEQIEAMSAAKTMVVTRVPPEDYWSIRKFALRRTGDAKDWLRIENSDRDELNPVCFSPDNRYLAWGSRSGTITVADLPALQSKIEQFQKRLERTPSK